MGTTHADSKHAGGLYKGGTFQVWLLTTFVLAWVFQQNKYVCNKTSLLSILFNVTCGRTHNHSPVNSRAVPINYTVGYMRITRGIVSYYEPE